MTRFVEAVLSPSNRPFLDDFGEFERRIVQVGLYNSLSQLLVKLTAPGVPDFYQGTELWDFSLVDPDNRRPVDYERRRQLLAEVDAAIARGEREALLESLMASRTDDRLKLYTAAMTLRVRREHQTLFARGSYTPVVAEGSRHENLFAFVRTHEGATALVAMPRLLATQTPDGQPPLGERFWGDTRVVLTAGATASLRDIFTLRDVPLSEHDGRQVIFARDLMDRFPIACAVSL